MSKKGFSQKDAKNLTRASRKQTSDMWHQAREDARSSGELNDRPASTPSKRAGNEPSSSTWGDFFTRLTGKK